MNIVHKKYVILQPGDMNRQIGKDNRDVESGTEIATTYVKELMMSVSIHGYHLMESLKTRQTISAFADITLTTVYRH